MLINKDPSIKEVIERVFAHFGYNFFEKYIEDDQEKIVDFWEPDLCAIGLKKQEKVIYISSWENRENPIDKVMYHVEFEIIDQNTLETNHLVKEISGISIKI
ncbi:MAG: hypothetical protein KDC55_12755 [Ignavibacteriae bacterium]|nr:hypothetical protein [Ignavibacteriota bacterium]